MTFAEELQNFRETEPDVVMAEVFVADLNGIARGKLVPVEALAKLATGGLKMPVSSPALDVFSEDVFETGLAFQTGDPDGAVVPVPGSLGRMKWVANPTAQVQGTILRTSGDIAPFDGRNVLAQVAARAIAMGLTPVAALEQEFYLIDQKVDAPPINPVGGRRLASGQVYELDVSRAFAPVLDDISAASQALGVATETLVSEFGSGQFEVNVAHVADPLQAADQIIALRRAIRGVTRAHGYDATFLAKPYGNTTGSGLHLHLSFLDREGVNIFSTGQTLEQAIGGCLRHMAESMLIFAPHLNSYRRLVPDNMAPVEALWGHDHRGVSIRVPETTGRGARLEHRVAGADANPYLVVAAVMAAALSGIEGAIMPPAPVGGQLTAGQGELLPNEWGQAEARFSGSGFIADWLGDSFQNVFGAIKRQERLKMLARVSDIEREVYLRRL